MPSSTLFLFLLTMVLFFPPFENFFLHRPLLVYWIRAHMDISLTSVSSASVFGARNLFPPNCESDAAHLFSM